MSEPVYNSYSANLSWLGCGVEDGYASLWWFLRKWITLNISSSKFTARNKLNGTLCFKFIISVMSLIMVCCIRLFSCILNASFSNKQMCLVWRRRIRSHKTCIHKGCITMVLTFAVNHLCLKIALKLFPEQKNNSFHREITFLDTEPSEQTWISKFLVPGSFKTEKNPIYDF